MKFPWANILIFALLLVQSLTGYFGLTNGREPQAWILWLHGAGAYALLLLLFYKSAVILDAVRRKRRWTARRIGFLGALALLVAVLLTGLLWTFNGPIYIGGFSLVSLHIYLALPLMVLMLWHSWHMRFILRVDSARDRRAVLRGLAAAAGGLALWWATGRAKAGAGLPGAARRFTGSYETGSYTPEFPVVSWIADRPPRVAPDEWLLRVEGAVSQPYSVAYDDLARLDALALPATLDCTGGWYTRQRWWGVPVAGLLDRAGVMPAAASVTFESATGYRRRFPLEEARGFLLALGTLTGEEGLDDPPRPLSPGHGYPVRLVAPGRRGMEWVKWVATVRVNETGAWRQSPLPLQ